ncbi:bifunctional WD40-YVTN repeat-like-containing domain superfamily/WD40-repeat-containing domain superfamily [Babesia duncani]|uniref:Bifunctional WD40-YVTN repeat-like-containing domain superfamily/WD40-repeat-containing domain superfamily n=1 Tax=Babesia duncani TaxID=323732 RepID=A0AAD9UQ64_9APIC|nr:bifunctional WD40-YVTN repeat-like-containing domain superfamily/WD40-repeat-containing domain superfamily [Babesia duncani]
MMYRCNIVAIVGSADSLDQNMTMVQEKRSSKFTSPWKKNMLIIWDDKKGCEVAQLVFDEPIRNVKLQRDLLFVVMDSKFYIYRLRDVELLDTVNTCYNPAGLCSVEMINNTKAIIAHPAPERGKVCVRVYGSPNSIETRDGYPRHFGFQETYMYIIAHKSRLTHMTLSSNGLLLVTCSQNGSMIRLFSSLNGTLLQQFKKCHLGVCIFTLSKDTQWLCVVSNRPQLYMYQTTPKARQKSELEPSEAIALPPVLDVNSDKPREQHFWKTRMLSSSSLSVCDVGCARGRFGARLLRHARGFLQATRPLCNYRISTDGPVMALTVIGNGNVLLVLKSGLIYKIGFNPVIRSLKLISDNHI